ncbi:uncharacterized protein MONBRDRAFT_26668 [Monosiga brevicollis MX1]|uniref:Uncharacterized protein n=1 Tax=Monosiga brevicollis TaxID=81824 RepID=A9V312_MONBE|nr:uncharacterized protein MONBRDRAFT_26668 [Monosiga brevicollis MX1]EDQ88106.1 predicted protein [Monosiga brevicollis MX1]|eukprot:XP_001747182.1 hypothetical protein [Monosiga brevicollis MX1]
MAHRQVPQRRPSFKAALPPLRRQPRDIAALHPADNLSLDSDDGNGGAASQLHRHISTMVKVSCLGKLRLLLKDPKSMSNKAIEICVTLLSLYLIVELNNIPQECALMSPCLTIYFDAGGSMDPSFPFASCGQMRRDCEVLPWLSFSRYLVSPEDDAESALADSPDLSPYVAFCECIDGSVDEVFCSFYFSTFIFLLLGILVIYFAEVTNEEDNTETLTKENRNPRRCAHSACVLYFLVALLYYDRLVGCSGPDFVEAQRTTVFLSAGAK